MNFEFKHSPSYTLLHMNLEPGEQIKAEAGSMVYMSPGFDVETKLGSGLLSAISRKFLGGESLFLNYYTAKNKSTISFAADLAGDIQHKKLNGESIYLQSSSYLCSTTGIEIKPQFGGLKTLIGGEGLFLLKVSGHGDLFYNSHGVIVPIEVDGSYIVDTGHIVAFEDAFSFKVKKSGGWKTTLLSGEGLVCEFTGKGTIWIQSRIPSSFIRWLTKLYHFKKGNI